MSYPPQDPRYPPPQAPGYPQQQYYGPPGVSPQAPWGVHPVTGIPYSSKQKVVAGLLQVFLGAFGAGRFYTGHIGMAIAQIAVVWLSMLVCGIGALWPLIDGIMMLSGSVTDSDGRPLRD